jgi:DNA polymerase delta subunit 3
VNSKADKLDSARLKAFLPVTEDYSSYESVDEEEPEEPEKPKKLTSKPSESKLKRNVSSKETKGPSKEVKKRASKGGGLSSKPVGGQSNIMTFFNKP